MRFAVSRQFRGSGLYLQSARSAVVAHTRTAPTIISIWAIVDVTHIGDIHIVIGAVVVEVSFAPIAALVAKANVAITIIDATVVADVGTPVATIKAVAVISVAPIARSPESTLIGSLYPPTGHPVIA